MSNPRGGVGRDGGESHIELTIVAAGTSSKEGAEDDDTDADVDDDTAPLVSRDANKHEPSTSKPAAPEETHATPASAVAMYAGGVLASSLTALGARLLHDRASPSTTSSSAERYSEWHS